MNGSPSRQSTVIVIGAGIAGLAAALRLAHEGCQVTVIDAQETAGGKLRTVPTDAGPADAGPTVLTMRPVFDALFHAVGDRLDDHLALHPLKIIARHFWRNGPVLDLDADRAQSEKNVAAVFGDRAAEDYRRHTDRSRRLFDALDQPVMQAARPDRASLAREVLRRPGLIGEIEPHRPMTGSLDRRFADPRLMQLYSRYATYVGGAPDRSPALLDLVSDAEARGVWHIEGGMSALPCAIERLVRARGAVFRYGTLVKAIDRSARGLTVTTDDGKVHADAVLFNGDPRALRRGQLGDRMRRAVPASATEPRSLSACVAAFAARPSGPELSHHNVFFSDVPNAEFTPIRAGRLPSDATLYICAQDRAGPAPTKGLERFEIILNAPPGLTLDKKDKTACIDRILKRLAQFGLIFDPAPGPEALTTPMEFDRLFPASLGALYGRSPEGMMAAFKRPTARTRIPGLYLAGGGAHPGPGLPMATLSARHAAEAILADLPSMSRSARTAMHGGMSMGSAMTARAPSRSSAS